MCSPPQNLPKEGLRRDRLLLESGHDPLPPNALDPLHAHLLVRMDREVDLLAVGAGRAGNAEHVLGSHAGLVADARDAIPGRRETNARVLDRFHAHRLASSLDHDEGSEFSLASPQYLHDPGFTARTDKAIVIFQHQMTLLIFP